MELVACPPRVAISCMCLVGCQPPGRQTSVGEPLFVMNSSLNKSKFLKWGMLIRVLLTPSEEGLACSVPAGRVGIQRETGSLPKIALLPPPPFESKMAARSSLAQRDKVKQGQGRGSNPVIKGN